MKMNKPCWPIVFLDAFIFCALAAFAALICYLVFLMFKAASAFSVGAVVIFVSVSFIVTLVHHLFRKDPFSKDDI